MHISPDTALQFLPYILSLAGGIFGIWKNKQKKTTEKVLDTVVLGIEHGSTIAARTGNADAVKWAIAARATADGVEQILAPRVQKLTEGAPDLEEQLKRRDVEAAITTRDTPPDDSGADRP